MSGMRWAAIGVFLFASTLNYLDRLLLGALAPTIRAELGISYATYGWVVFAFNVVYAFSSPAMGMFLDGAGLTRGIVTALGVWSIATLATGWVGGLVALVACRLLLGAAQSGGVPAFGKASSIYLAPAERALGNALSQFGISIGSASAPLLAAWARQNYSWRAAFWIAGSLGFAWIPVWLFVSRRVPPQYETGPSRGTGAVRDIMRKPQYWGFVAAAVLGMSVYSLWANWTTVYLTETWHLTESAANQGFAWIPPLCALGGGFTGGGLSFALARRGMEVQAARRRVCLAASALLLVTALVPLAPSPAVATALIALSFFFSTCFSVNLYSMPLEAFGTARAGFAIASLTFAFGMMTAFSAPLIGKAMELVGFGPVCVTAAALPLGASAILYWTRE